jgi:hypothetical protein
MDALTEDMNTATENFEKNITLIQNLKKFVVGEEISEDALPAMAQVSTILTDLNVVKEGLISLRTDLNNLRAELGLDSSET